MELNVIAAPSVQVVAAPVRVVMWRSRLAAVVGVLAAAVGVRTIAAYLSHGAYFALATVVVLIAVDGAGLFSLMRARAAILVEWQSLFAAEPASRLWVRRRDRLLALKALATPPDIDALMAVDEAELAGTASFGRYLVAASVLIGLVGTFAGLSETIAGFAPVMGDVNGELGTRLLAPLSGLEVTFGASIVAIIATLALSLAAGDLALSERALLARLEERTRHELVPAIFPASESVAAQTLAALATMTANLSREWAVTTAAQAARLEHIVAAAAAAIAASGKAAAEGMAAASESATNAMTAASEAGVSAIAHSASEASRSLSAAGTTAAEGMAAATKAATHTLAAATATATGALTAATTRATDAIAATSATAAQQSSLSLAAAAETVATASIESSTALSTASRDVMSALSTTSREALARLESLTTSVAQSFADTARETWSANIAALKVSAERLEAAAQAMAGATDKLQPSVAHLVPELAALSRETALLAARVDDAEVDEAMLAEMQRLGEAMGEVKALLTLGRTDALESIGAEP